jgi:hypothetical protein
MPQVVVARQVRSRTLDAPSYAASLMSGGGASMDSPHVFFRLAEIVDRLRCIALSISQFRLSGRGVYRWRGRRPR